MAAIRQRLGLRPLGIAWPAARVASEPAPVSEPATATAELPLWHHAALLLTLIVSLGLGLYRIGREGYANEYYSAAVKSMLQNWHAFFYGSFDSAGFVTVDKPPLGLWIQTASAYVFGFHGWSLMLPQILAATASVYVVYRLVRRAFGPVAALIAAAALAVAPINIAAARNNTADCLLAFALLLAAVCVLRAAERGSLRWLMLAMICIGLGFNIKMLQAYLVLPAVGLVYLITPALPFKKRVWHLAAACGLLLAVSFSWATIVELTPASARPYIGSSSNNSVYNLIFGYNGLNRLIPNGWSIFGITSGSSTGPGAGGGGVGGVSENGPKSIIRLLNTSLGGQIGWLLPMAVIGLLAAWGRPLLRQFDGRKHSLVLWGSWLITQVAFFSVAGFYHRYYLSMLSPAIAALTGIGLVALWGHYRRGGWRALLLPAAVAITAASQLRTLRDYDTWFDRLAPAIAIGAGIAALGLLAMALLGGRIRFKPNTTALVTVAALSLLIAPATWSGVTAARAQSAVLPVAGPSGADGAFGGIGGNRGNFTLPAGAQPPSDLSGAQREAFTDAANRSGPGEGGQVSQAMIDYLLANQESATYLVAVSSAGEAEGIILQTGKAVMAMGGFSGSDQILTADSFAALVKEGKVRFVMTGGRGGFGGAGGFTGQRPDRNDGASGTDAATNLPQGQPPANVGGSAPAGIGGGTSGVTEWVTANCKVVDAATYASMSSTQATGGNTGGTLYDCQGAAS